MFEEEQRLQDELLLLESKEEKKRELLSMREEIDSILRECEERLNADSSCWMVSDLQNYVKEVRKKLDVGKRSVRDNYKYLYLLQKTKRLRAQIEEQLKGNSVMFYDTVHCACCITNRTTTYRCVNNDDPPIRNHNGLLDTEIYCKIENDDVLEKRTK